MSKILLIHSDDFAINISDHNKQGFIFLNTSNLQETTNWEGLNINESFSHNVCIQLDADAYQDVNIIVVDKNIGGSDGWETAIILASHIRLHSFMNVALNTLPVILTHYELPDLASNKSPYILQKIVGFPTAKGFYFKKYSDLFSVNSRAGGEPTFDMKIFSLPLNMKQIVDTYSDLLQPIPTKFEVTSPHDDRHGIANEWGAFKLASSFGHEISYNLPQTLYFKYLTAKFTGNNKVKSVNSAENILPQQEKVLLIDDNADKGWKEALEKILPADVSTAKFAEDVNVEDLAQYSLVFLDLRLPESNGSLPDPNTAVKLLSRIKDKYPYLPVIIFTASNKAWNYKTLLNNGADGYFIKESPENAKDLTFSHQNREALTDMVKASIEKGKILKPYWEGIDEILITYTSLVENRININYTALFRERIKERLYMFFGLLKRGFEDSQFNQANFFYSDNELAFMTLWSTLNEISDAYYITRIPTPTPLSLKDGKGNLKKLHPDNTPIKSFYQSGEEKQIRNQQEYLFKNKYKFEGFASNGEPKTYNTNGNRYSIKKYVETSLKYDKQSFPPYKLIVDDYNPYQKLHMHIAYLILAKNEFKGNKNEDTYLNDLSRLNGVRNSLYLTHGDEIASGFYSQEEKLKSKHANYNIKPTGDIKSLFELIAFLLTAKNIVVQF